MLHALYEQIGGIQSKTLTARFEEIASVAHNFLAQRYSAGVRIELESLNSYRHTLKKKTSPEHV